MNTSAPAGSDASAAALGRLAARLQDRFRTALPGDPDTSLSRRQVHGACWSVATPRPVAAPRLLAWSPEVAAMLELDAEALAGGAFTPLLAGNALLPGMTPWAACYGGHQFGQWAGQLGDGRAISLGEFRTTAGQHLEVQLKGAGPTPYSRTADGRAVLRSSIREFLCSEAMHHLGVPTTRALSLVTTGEAVVRDVMYDGNPRPEPGAIVCRVAPGFVRFGNFELPSSRGDVALLGRLVDFTIDTWFPHLEGDAAARRAAWFREVAERTAWMVAHWMRVGFVHGVMNTDNMSILGLTIDYGPYGWVDHYDPDWTPNTTDAAGRRYAFGRQPQVALWNLACLANALVPLFPAVDPLHAGLDAYRAAWSFASDRMTRDKFGLHANEAGDEQLVEDGYALLARGGLDMTCFFRDLARVDPAAPDASLFADAFYDDDMRRDLHEALQAWTVRYAARVAGDPRGDAGRRRAMDAVNPRYVLRNWLAQEAIEMAEGGDLSQVHRLLDVMRAPYAEREGLEHFAARRPEWARHKVGCSMLSCSS